MNYGQLLCRSLGTLALGMAMACAPSNKGTHTLPPSTGNVTLCLTGTGIENWQGVDVTIQGITLTSKDSGKPVTLFAAPTPGLPVNLALLDHTDQLVGNFPVPVGTYTGATLAILGGGSGNPVVQVNPSENPAPGFPGVDPGIFNAPTILGLDASTPSLLTRTITFQSPIVVATDHGGVLDLAFDLTRPTFLVDHGTPTYNRWTMDFDGVLSQRTITDSSQLILNPIAGSITSVAGDGTSLSFMQRFKAEGLSPVTVPQLLKIRPDTGNGTLCLDLSSDTSKVVKDFGSLSGISSATPVVVAGRVQADGSVMASRLWIGEGTMALDLLDGHLLYPQPDHSWLLIEGEGRNDGPSNHGWGGLYVTVDAQTKFFLRDPAHPQADATPIGTGPSLLSSGLLTKGFRLLVHSRWTGTDRVARTVDILAARFNGPPSAVTPTQFTCTIPKGTFTSDPGPEIVVLPFAKGFTWSNDTLDAPVGLDFGGFAGLSVDFGGTAGAFGPWTSTGAVWGDAANPGGWSAKSTAFQSLRLPDGSVASPWVASASGGSFGLSLPGGTQTVTVDLNTATALAYLNHGVDVTYSGFGISLESFDLTTTAGLSSFQLYLARGWPVRVFGYPDGAGHITATTIFIQDPQ